MALKIQKVLISEAVDAVCENILRQHDIEVTTKTGLTKEELIKEIECYDGLVVRSATKVTADIIAAGKELRVIGRAGTGVDNIDCDAATRHGVLVLNAPGGNAISAAELTCGMITSLSRNIPEACASLKSGKWDRKKFMGNELQGKTLAIIGLGRIGREVAFRMQAFGMTTIGFDPLVPAEVSKEFGVESLDLESIWPLADYITVHTPLIPQTRNLLNDDVFSKCRKGVKVVNCARGGIIDEDALVRALESDQCGGAGLDVFIDEPPKNTALVKHPHVICTPHLGASTVEAQSRVAEEIAQQFVDLQDGKFVLGVVNSPAFCHSLADENRPWVSLCQSLGAILGALLPKDEKDITLTLHINGSEINKKGNVLSVAALIGFLKQRLHSDANFINAPLLAKEAGVKVTAVNSVPANEDFSLPVSVMLLVKAGDVSHNVIGTLNGKDALLYAIDGVGFENPVRLSKNIIFCRGKHSSDMTVQLLGSLVKLGEVHGASWSSTFDGCSWCVINGSISAEDVPTEVAEYVDFWAQLTL